MHSSAIMMYVLYTYLWSTFRRCKTAAAWCQLASTPLVSLSSTPPSLSPSCSPPSPLLLLRMESLWSTPPWNRQGLFWPKSSEGVEVFFDTGKELQSRGNVCLLLTRRRSCVQCCRGQTRTWPASTSVNSCQACLQGHLWVLQGDHPEKVFQGSLVSRFFHDFQRCQEWGRVTIPTTSLWRTSWPLRSGSLWRWKGKLLHLKSANFLRITAWLRIDKFPNRWEKICQTLDFLTLGQTTRSLREAPSKKYYCFLFLKAILKSQAGTSPVDGWRSQVRQKSLPWRWGALSSATGCFLTGHCSCRCRRPTGRCTGRSWLQILLWSTCTSKGPTIMSLEGKEHDSWEYNISIMMIAFHLKQAADEAISIWGWGHRQKPHQHIQDKIQENLGLSSGFPFPFLATIKWGTL